MSVADLPVLGAGNLGTAPPLWIRVSSRVVIVQVEGMFGGMIEARPNGFEAQDLFGRTCGTFATRGAARRYVEAMLGHPSVRAWLRRAAGRAGRAGYPTASAEREQ